MKFNIRLLYLYLFSFVGLLITVIGLIRLADLGIKVYVFRGADQYMTQPRMAEPTKETAVDPKLDAKWIEDQKMEMQRQRQREFSGAIAMVLIGLPLYLYHWKTIAKEKA